MPQNKRAIGSRYEQEAAAFLIDQGLQILKMNYRCRLGEIDLIAEDGGTLVFCEVKYRRDLSTGDPAEAVDWRKQQTIFRVAQWYMKASGCPQDTPCRFDVVTVTGTQENLQIRWIPNGFGGW